MITYRLGVINELFRAAPSFRSVYEAAVIWTGSDSYKFDICESYLFISAGDDLILTVEFGAFWDKWFDKNWSKGMANKQPFEYFCLLIQRYVRRCLRKRS